MTIDDAVLGATTAFLSAVTPFPNLPPDITRMITKKILQLVKLSKMYSLNVKLKLLIIINAQTSLT